MDSQQASAPPDGTPLVAVRLAGGAALRAFDRAWDAGAAVLPLDPQVDAGRCLEIAGALGAAEIVEDGGTRPLPDPVPVPAGTALVVRTSGTTGAPRGVVLDHAALRHGVDASLTRLGCVPGDRWLCVLPLHHVAGVLVVLRARALGTEPIVHPSFDVDAVASAAATHVALVPTMLHRLLDRGVDVAGFKRILLGGAAPPAGLLDRARDAGAHVTTTYGMTETAGGCVYDGLPLDGVAAAVEPGGEILLRGPVLADHYRDGRALTPLTADGWFHTSDIGRWEGGRLVVTGRSDDVVVTGGVNVSTTAVAATLREHPAVADAAVVGVDDREWGQRLVAFVVPDDPARPPAVGQLRAFVRARAEPAGVPREVIVVATLPRTALGKVDRGALARRARLIHR